MTLTVTLSALRAITGPAPAPGLSVGDDGVIRIFDAVGGIEIALTPRDAFIVGGQLLRFAIANAGLAGSPPAGEA